MKSFILFFIAALTATVIAKAQVPQQFAFQGVARDATNKPVANKTVSVRFTLHQGSESGPTVYKETHSPQTAASGVFNIAVGAGNTLSGSFSAINWNAGPYFLQVELDAAGGSNYATISTTQLQSVPYAMVSSKADNLTGVDNPNNGDVLEFQDGAWIKKPKTKRYLFSGSGSNLSPDLRFVTNVATVLIEKDNPTITLSATKTLGSDAPGGGESVSLVLGYRKMGDAQNEFTPFIQSVQINGLRVPPRTRLPFTLSGSFQTAFKAGEVYEIGMLGKSFNGGSWNDNGPSTGFVEVSY